MNIGLIGFGYWGPNVAKNLAQISDCKFNVIVDKEKCNLEKAKHIFPNINLFEDLKQALNYADAFIIATPIESHFPIAKFLLENKKHVLIQKPMAHSKKCCVILNAIAQKNKLSLMVAHTFLFSPSIRKIKKDIETNQYGNLNYISSCRVNLGLFQRHHNVIWDLAPHDFSIIRYLYNKKPKYISAIGQSHTPSKLIDCANITIGYDDNFLAMININWLSAIKIRDIIVSGDKKMVLYDDSSLEKVKIYDSGVEYSNDVFTYRKGDIYIPKLEEKEAIYFECLEFINSIKNKKQPISNGLFGQEVVQMIEAANKSIQKNGKPISL
jgi:predicted dehydrogenase